jgi:hypothetical protein
MLTTAADFFETFHNGMRGGERRFFTYVLCEDSLRCAASRVRAAWPNNTRAGHGSSYSVNQPAEYMEQ